MQTHTHKSRGFLGIGRFSSSNCHSHFIDANENVGLLHYYYFHQWGHNSCFRRRCQCRFHQNHHHPGQQLFNNRFICIFVFFLTKLFALHSDLVHHVPIHTYIYAILFVLPILWAQMDCVCVCVCVYVCTNGYSCGTAIKLHSDSVFNSTGLHISFRSIRSFMFFFSCWLPVFFCSTNAHC